MPKVLVEIADSLACTRLRPKSDTFTEKGRSAPSSVSTSSTLFVVRSPAHNDSDLRVHGEHRLILCDTKRDKLAASGCSCRQCVKSASEDVMTPVSTTGQGREP